MPRRPGRDPASIPEGAESPIAAAISGRDSKLLGEVADALRHRAARLAFQPIRYDDPRRGTAFYEGLLRVPDATGRILPAAEFIGAAEATELGRELDCAALDLGLRTLEANPGIRLSINMSARSIGYPKWIRMLERRLKRAPALGERLILEISERSAMQVPELVIEFMDRLLEHGIAFALDDFGSGAVTFHHFRDFFFDAVKIDGRYVRGIDTDLDNQALVRALIALAREFDMMVIAECVETDAEAKYLLAAGVEYLQGYLIGAPSLRPPWAAAGAKALA